MSQVLQLILDRAKFCTSLLQSLDQSLQYGDINREEHVCANKLMTQWLSGASYDQACQIDYAARLRSFREFIKKSKERERKSIH